MHAKTRREQLNHWGRGIPWERHPPHAYDRAVLMAKFTNTLGRHAEITRKDYDKSIEEFVGYLDSLKKLPAPPS
jgi:hypothetical protein